MSWEGSSLALGKNVGKEYFIVVQQLEKEKKEKKHDIQCTHALLIQIQMGNMHASKLDP
jgi:hypothetical protein